jgi:hypothetical protein
VGAVQVQDGRRFGNDWRLESKILWHGVIWHRMGGVIVSSIKIS